ncbi:urease accessory protein [Rhodovulum sp. ES.010]|uniref:HupE/UreJ family protein n=1 Tax=Rhodovulum sp. ES.010 TaxID=1882821 RepID=UPI0009293288|nr:HupE/UreJ family protein [Rhodovulum sp. ES.010]SIO41584.1 urease accessory protein [Rhodovulum sp. ES.010]
MKRLAFVLPASLTAAGPAFAHLDPVAHGSFAAGFSHPVFGADHVLAMLAVGLWAVTLGGRALWALPAAFVGAMAAGFALALVGLPLPAVEPMIVASVLVLGVLVALAVCLPVGMGAAVVGMLALFHGHAHAAEMGGASAMAYLGGFVLATALLHGAGVLAGWALARFGGAATGRAAGGVVAAAGSALLLAG